MQPDNADAARLWDMREASQTVIQLTAGYSYESYLADRKTQLAVERLIEIIGEAARHVSQKFQQQHPSIQWRKIIVQRHVLAHEYGEIKQDRIWALIAAHVPALLDQLEPLVPSPPAEAP